MNAYFNRFPFTMTARQALAASHVGACDADVAALAKAPAIARQLSRLDPDMVRDELREYGAWDSAQLADHADNLQRVLWLAACAIREEIAQARQG